MENKVKVEKRKFNMNWGDFEDFDADIACPGPSKKQKRLLEENKEKLVLDCLDLSTGASVILHEPLTGGFGDIECLYLCGDGASCNGGE